MYTVPRNDNDPSSTNSAFKVSTVNAEGRVQILRDKVIESNVIELEKQKSDSEIKVENLKRKRNELVKEVGTHTKQIEFLQSEIRRLTLQNENLEQIEVLLKKLSFCIQENIDLSVKNRNLTVDNRNLITEKNQLLRENLQLLQRVRELQCQAQQLTPIQGSILPIIAISPVPMPQTPILQPSYGTYPNQQSFNVINQIILEQGTENALVTSLSQESFAEEDEEAEAVEPPNGSASNSHTNSHEILPEVNNIDTSQLSDEFYQLYSHEGQNYFVGPRQ